MADVFIAGSTGYLGRRLAESLAARGSTVLALVRPGAEARAPRGSTPVAGDALRAGSYQRAIPRGATFVQLVGVPRPSPFKGAAFRAVDRVAGLASVVAAREAGVSHFIYLSVAQPAPVMGAYLAVRAEVERAIHLSGLNATVLRPWYVTGPGHRWPLALAPLYAVFRSLPATREAAERLGLVTDDEMNAALVGAVEKPASGVRVWGVTDIRNGGS